MSEIQSTVKYEKIVFIEIEIGKDALDINDACPFKRTDYYEDGSRTKWYGLEISEKAYKNLMVMLAEIAKIGNNNQDNPDN